MLYTAYQLGLHISGAYILSLSLEIGGPSFIKRTENSEN